MSNKVGKKIRENLKILKHNSEKNISKIWSKKSNKFGEIPKIMKKKSEKMFAKYLVEKKVEIQNLR